ncbi:hypothetical protein SCHPADRAFT_932702 [Schizopora paradoxa]|uniref:Uncharacterized protein n=1 Tax=Schizopora paradoxa TaxID=27342 RepID=A0A0H2RQI4_9AGAM|nr:hypothetical protein SCHPADRAFT_932702 [Schizopora paradoxa]
MMRQGQQRKPVRVSITNLADELLQSILGLLVDCDKKVYDDGGSDIHGISSSRRALRLSGTCRAFRNALLRMPGAWVVVSSEHPGEMFLTMCVERSSSRGLRLYHANFRGYDRVVKLLRHLLSLQALGRVRIDIVSLEIDVGHITWSGAPLSPQKEMAQLLGNLDNKALSVLNVHYFKNFRYSSVDDGLEADSNGEDRLDDVEVEMNGGLPYELRNLMQSPHLKSAHFQNTIPPPGMMTSLSKLVLELQIHATYDSDDDEDDPDKWAVQNLLDLLRSQPTLEDLTLEFYDTGSLGFNNADDNRLELPCVKTFSLHWHGNTNFDGRINYRSSSIPRLFKLLDLKNVEVFRFRIQSESVEDYARGTDHELPLLLDNHLKFFLGDNGYFLNLESFYLKFYSSNERFLYLPTSYIRNIKHLSLDINIKLSLEEEPVRLHFRVRKFPRATAISHLPDRGRISTNEIGESGAEHLRDLVF